MYFFFIQITNPFAKYIQTVLLFLNHKLTNQPTYERCNSPPRPPPTPPPPPP